MAFRFWLFVGALVGLAAIAAAAYGSHAVDRFALIPTVAKIFDIAQLHHALHAIMMFGIATLLAATEGRRMHWASLMLNFAALAFFVGILLFSGGIYLKVLANQDPPTNLIPVGGFSLIVGWGALAMSVFGFRRIKRPSVHTGQ